MINLQDLIRGIDPEHDRKYDLRILSEKNPYVLDLIVVLWRHKNGLRRIDAIDQVYQRRFPKGLSMPKEFEKTLQSVFNAHNPESLVS